MNRCHGDDGFGPTLDYNFHCYHFDFTLYFEECIFSLVPAILAITLALLRIYSVLGRPRTIEWPVGRALKLTAYTALAIFQVTLTILWSRGYGFQTRLTIPSSAIALANTLILAVLSSLEHNRVLRPCFVVQAYYFFTSVLDLPRVRTQWLLNGNATLASLVTVTLVLKLAILASESIHKYPHRQNREHITSPLERCGLFGRSLLLWLIPLLRLGYVKDLDVNDLFPLDSDLKGDLLTNRLSQKWSSANKSRKHCLSLAVLRTFAPEIFLAWLPRSAHIGFVLAQPFLVNTTLSYIQNHTTYPVSYGYGLIGAYGIVYIGIAVANQMYQFLMYRSMVKIRGALVGLIYRDMLSVRAERGNSSSALSLMSTDVDRICMSARMVIDIVPNLVQMGLAIWILTEQLGAVSVAPIIVAILCAGAVLFLGRLIPQRQRKWMASIQKRVGITSEALGSMKGIKMSGLTDSISKQIQGLRDFELSESKKFRRLQIFLVSMNMVPMLSIQAVTFTVYAVVAEVSGSGALGINQAFTSLTLLGILIMPLALLVASFTNIFQALSCLDRIQDFLLLEKRKDYRSSGTIYCSSESDENASNHAPGEEPQVQQRASSNSATGARLDSVTDEARQEQCAIRVKSASFGWTQSAKEAILRDVNVDIPASSLTFVVGPVASGKSTLLKSFIGETYLHSGTVRVSDFEELAYCDQDSWILNQTIRENIVAFSDYTKEFYDTVIRACQLEEDLRHLPRGDLSNVGSQGISLSGGQKARVALARAVYSRKKVVIMDDVMKGLDADTSAKCFKALLGESGLLRRDGITVVLATHNGKSSPNQWFPLVDHLVVLTGGGSIASTGTFEALRDSDNYISSLAASYTDKIKDGKEDHDSLGTKVVKTDPEVPNGGVSEKYQLEREVSAAATNDERIDGRGKMTSSLPYYVKSLMSISFLIYCSLILFQTACRIVQPLWLRFWTTANARNPNENPGKWVGVYVMFSVLNLGGLITQIHIFLLRIVPRSAKSLHWEVLKVAMAAPMSYFVSTDVGVLVNRFSQDMTLIDFPLPVALNQFSEQLVSAVGELILICVSSGYLAAIIPVLFVLLFFIQRFYLRTSRQLRLLDLELKSPVYSFFISSFSGLATIRAFSWSERSYQQHLQRLDTSQRPFYLLYSIQRWLMLVLELIVAGICVLLVGLSVAIRDRIDPGLLGVALSNVTTFSSTITQVIIFWTDLETSLGAITRIREFIGSTPQEEQPSSSSDADDHGKSIATPPANWPAHGNISISGLRARYGSRTVLHGVDLIIEAGQKVAICGRSGSGKSTLLALLLRLYEADSGTVSIDGIDTATVPVRMLRERLAALPQDPLLLAGSVRYNLDPAGRCGDSEMLDALRKTGIGGVIEDKGGLDAEFDPDWFSAGQKQLFCLARVMLRSSRILLLDEATSSLDHRTDDLIQSLIRKEFAGWTVVVVAHRLKTVADFDKVAVLQGGMVAEFDNPQTLLENGGLFKNLWDLQE